jgi:class 3 adenylate cyclase/tetratricopeptide (TPR) repeat protein
MASTIARLRGRGECVGCVDLRALGAYRPFVRCVVCDADLIAGKPFCAMCGAKVALRCATCGGALEPQFRFCPQCGTSVAPSPTAPEPASTPAPTPEPAPSETTATLAPTATPAPHDGERKQVTVLFCDLVGSTAIAERLDPEDYREIIDRYLERVFPEIYRFGGIVNTLAGDGLMALFGAPVAHEDDPRRAVRAALAIRETLARLAETLRGERGIELQARIGIHTGPVVVGTVGNSFKMDYTAIGDTTNLAARLQTAARPGSILMSESTQRLVRGFFVVEPTGPLEVRGKSDPVVAYEVVGRAATASPMTIAEERGLTPLVGRTGELARLEMAFDRVDDEKLAVVAVVGEAGIGKSRLLYEFRRRLDGRPAVFFEGRCSSINQVVPYHPFISMLRHYFELGPDEAPDVAAEKLASTLGVQYDQLERMYPLLARLLALPSGTPADLPRDAFKSELSTALAGLVLGENAPVVFVIEDLHWIDEPSRELLGTLLDRLGRAPVLVLVTHRPDAQAVPKAGGFRETIELARLTSEEIREILRAVAGGPLPADLETALVSRAAGSPFFAEELVRALVEEGHLEKNGHGLRLHRPLAEVPIPGTIHEVIAARLDRLAPQTKRVVQVAAVLGRQFRRVHLGGLLKDETIDVDAELAELVRRGILHAKVAPGSDQFRFGESLTQEVAYEGLLLRQRRQLHERVARYLDTQPGGGPERSALRAHHWSRSDDRGRAAEALMQAARDAENVPSYRTAADFYRRAWEAAEAASGEVPDDRHLRLALEATNGLSRLVVFFGLPLVEEAARAAERGRELAEYFHDTEATAGFYYTLGVMKMTRGGRDFARGLELAERALELAERKGLRLASARIVRGIAINYVIDGRFEAARARIDPLLATLEATEDPARPNDLYLSSRWVKDMVLYSTDDLEAALVHTTETVALGERVENRTIRCIGSVLLAQIHCLRGEYEQAAKLADRSLAIAVEIGNLSVFPAAGSVALIARTERGEPFEPAPYVDCIEKGLTASGFMQVNLRFVIEAMLAIGDLARARYHAEALHDIVGGRFRQALVGVSYGDVMQHLGRLDVAAGAYREAATAAEAIGSRSVLVAATIGLAEIAVTAGEEPDAGALERARALCAELGLGRYAARLARVAPSRSIAFVPTGPIAGAAGAKLAPPSRPSTPEG